MMFETPALVGIPRRSRNNPSQVGQSIERACQVAGGIDRILPVIHDGRVVALVQGRGGSNVVDLYDVPKFWCALNSYADINEALRAQRTHTTRFSKNATTAGTATAWYDLWPVGGDPVAGTYPGAALTSVQHNDESAGAIRHGGDVSPSNKHLIRIESLAPAGTYPSLVIYDRVLTYEACTISNVNQLFVNSLPALRYIGAGEPGLKIMATVQTTMGATANAYTQLQYTDQAGNTLQSMPVTGPINVIVSANGPTATLGARIAAPHVSGSTVSIGPYLPLAAGDSGVRLLDNVTNSAINTGTLAYVLCQPLAIIPMQIGENIVPNISMMDNIMQMTGFAFIKDGACLAPLLHLMSTTGTTYSGRIDTVWG